MIKRYVIIRDNKDDICYIKYEQLEGFAFKPLNKLSYNNSVIVNKMVLFKPELIELVLRKKIRNKLNLYLQLILSDMDDSDDDSSLVRATLDEISRYRQLILNTYRKYLEERYVELLISKLAMLENELKNRLDNSINIREVIEEHKRSR